MQMQFHGGLVTNEVYHPRSRPVSAAYLRNCRVDGNGFLISRKGRVAAEAPDVFSYEDAYGGDALSKIDPPTVRYSEAGQATLIEHLPIKLVLQAVKLDTSELAQDFPTQQGDTGESPPLLSPRTVVGEMSDPLTVETVRIVDTEDAFGEFEKDPNNAAINFRANVHTLSVTHIDTEKIAIRFRIVSDINLSVRIVHYESKQVVRHLRDTTYLDGGSQDEEPDQTGDYTGPRRKEVIWDGRDDVENPVLPGTYFVEFQEAIPIHGDGVTNQLTPVTDYEYRHSFLPFTIQWEVIELTVGTVADATHVDVYATEDKVSTRYFWIARLPVNATGHYHFPVLDVNTEPPLTFETPDWEYIAVNEFRAYVAEANSERIYLSHFNPGTGEQLYRNFTDFIDLDLNGGVITGLHFLRDTHLVIYASNQLQILATDPIPELHSVIDFIKPRDEKGEFIGCISSKSIVDMGGIHYFLATDKRVYVFDGSRLREMSDKVHGVLSRIHFRASAVGFSYDRHYFLSVALDAEDEDPDTTLVYDTIHNVWWQDDFGVTDAMKDADGNAYGVIDGTTYQLYTGETDNGQPIRRTWRSHPLYGKLSQWWESVHVSPQDPAVIDVAAYTEQDRATQQLNIESVRDVFGQRMGMSLWGRTLTVEIQTESPVAIDRIAVNEQIRM